MKNLTVISLGLTLIALSGCGLRGELERPEPLWGDPQEVQTEDDPVPEEVDEAALRQRLEADRRADSSYRDPDTGEVVWAKNENGGDKPIASPTEPIQSGGLPPVSDE